MPSLGSSPCRARRSAGPVSRRPVRLLAGVTTKLPAPSASSAGAPNQSSRGPAITRSSAVPVGRQRGHGGRRPLLPAIHRQGTGPFHRQPVSRPQWPRPKPRQASPPTCCRAPRRPRFRRRSRRSCAGRSFGAPSRSTDPAGTANAVPARARSARGYADRRGRASDGDHGGALGPQRQPAERDLQAGGAGARSRRGGSPAAGCRRRRHRWRARRDGRALPGRDPGRS